MLSNLWLKWNLYLSIITCLWLWDSGEQQNTDRVDAKNTRGNYTSSPQFQHVLCWYWPWHTLLFFLLYNMRAWNRLQKQREKYFGTMPFPTTTDWSCVTVFIFSPELVPSMCTCVFFMYGTSLVSVIIAKCIMYNNYVFQILHLDLGSDQLRTVNVPIP